MLERQDNIVTVAVAEAVEDNIQIVVVAVRADAQSLIQTHAINNVYLDRTVN